MRQHVVGREREVELADRLRAAAAAGSSRLMLVSGESGIGKTHLARAVADAAAADGGLVLWGAGYEDLSIPYLPVVSALRALVDEHEGLAALLFGAATSDAPAEPTVEVPAAARLELFHAVADVVLTTAAERLVVLVIDDLQWVDAASLDLVTHVLAAGVHAQGHRPVRLLLVVTYRTPIVNERVGRTLSRLRREPGATEITLGPLAEVEVDALLREVGPAAPTSRLLHAVHHAAAGNPLLAREVLRQGLECGDVVERDARMDLAAAREVLGPPADLDTVVADRVASLDGALHEVLRTAALLGEGWSPNELAAVTDDAPDVARLLSDAEADELVVVSDGRYRFAHPQIRHALFSELRGTARQRAHLRIADGLERLGGAGRTIAVFTHLALAGGLAEEERTLRAAVSAGRQALAVGAWADAAAAFDVALARQRPDTPWRERVDLLVLATWAAFHDFDLAGAERHGRAAIQLAADHGDTTRWGAALLPLARTRATQVQGDSHAIDADIRGYLGSAPDSEPRIRSQLLAQWAEVQAGEGHLEDAAEAAEAAVAALDRSDDPQAHYRAHFAVGLVALYAVDPARARDGFTAAGDAARRLPTDPWVGMGLPGRLVLVDALAGDLGLADERVAGGLAHQRRSSGWAEQSFLTSLAAMVALARGRFRDADHYAREAEMLARRSGFPFTPLVLYPTVAQLRLLVGDAGGAHDVLAEWRADGGRGTWRLDQAVDALSGTVAGVRRAMIAKPWPDPPPRLHLSTLMTVALHAEVAVAVGDPAMAAAARPLLREAYGRGVRLTVGWVASVARLLGEIACSTGDWDDAGLWLAAAEQDMPALPPEAARVRLALGRFELDRPGGDRARGTHLVTDAAESLDRMGAVGLLSPARGLLGDLASGTARTILFTDLVSSTELNVRAGDDAWVEVIREHDAIVNRRLRIHGGIPFKHLGDGVAAWFASSGDAVDSAIALHDDLARASAAHPELPLLMRAGLAVGRPIGHAGDLFGLAVTKASRICDLANAGQVLVSSEVAALLHGQQHALRPVGRHRLKGFPDEDEVYEVAAASSVLTR
jgi:class 3 adenylate cyclase